MSEFDKEAEREKLREKYEQDEADRESTRQMSELLLQGATMTNRHCDECGNPIFRYDGQEFCANCQQAEGEDQQVEDADQEAESPQQEADREQTPQQSGGDGPREPEPDRSQQAQPRTDRAGQEPTPEETANRSRTEPTTAPEEAVDRPAGAQGRAGDGTTRGPDEVENRSSRERPVQDRTARGQSGEVRSSDRREGEAALWNALTKFARKAEATDDPREASDHLAAAREAAEALSALRR